MNLPVSDRVRIGTCSGPADAALVRSIFAAHGIDVVVAAENHAGLLGGLGGSLLSLDIWVAEEDSEEASALLDDLREREGHGTSGDDDDDDDVDGVHCHDSFIEHETAGSMDQRIDRRRRTGVALMLGCCLTFGTAHIFTGAWMRGLALAALELIGIMWISQGDAFGGFTVAVAIAADLIGAVWRVRVSTLSELPMARVRGLPEAAIDGVRSRVAR
jgi:hypothetical protein